MFLLLSWTSMQSWTVSWAATQLLNKLFTQTDSSQCPNPCQNEDCRKHAIPLFRNCSWVKSAWLTVHPSAGALQLGFPHTHANMHTYNISPQVPVHREMHPKSHPIWICPLSWTLDPVMSLVLHAMVAWTQRSDCMCVCVCVHEHMCVWGSVHPPSLCLVLNYTLRLCAGEQTYMSLLQLYRLQASSTLWGSSWVWYQRDSGWGNPIQTMWKVCFWACFKGVVHPKMKHATWHLA